MKSERLKRFVQIRKDDYEKLKTSIWAFELNAMYKGESKMVFIKNS